MYFTVQIKYLFLNDMNNVVFEVGKILNKRKLEVKVLFQRSQTSTELSAF